VQSTREYSAEVSGRKEASQADRNDGGGPIAYKLKLVFSSFHCAGLYMQFSSSPDKSPSRNVGFAGFPHDDNPVFQELGQLILGIVNSTVILPSRANENTINKLIIP